MCLWVDKFIFILSYSFPCRFIKVTLIALSPHPFCSTRKGFAVIGNLVRTLGCFITLLVNVSWGSITSINDVLYLVSHSLIFGIFGILYIFFGVWNCVASFVNYNISSITFLKNYVEWLPDLIVFANFESLLDLCSLPFYHSSLEKNIATNFNIYNICLLIFNS